MKKKQKEPVFKEAITDLQKELSALGKEKADLQKRLQSIDTGISSSERTEKELKDRIARLIKKEANLNEKKKGIEAKQDAVSEKLGKVKKIKYELESV